MNAWPFLELGGNSPVQAYLRHSMMVYGTNRKRRNSGRTDGFASAISANDECKWLEELDDIAILWTETAYALDEKLID